MRQLLWLFGMLAGLLVAGGCRDTSRDDEFKIVSKLFVFNYRVATATYLVDFRSTATLGDGLVAVVAFDDPAGGPDIVVREPIRPSSGGAAIASPPVYCIVKDKPYVVTIRIVDAAGKLVQQLETTVTSSQDQTILPDKPLVVGPGYSPNPGTVEAPGGPPVACPQ